MMRRHFSATNPQQAPEALRQASMSAVQTASQTAQRRTVQTMRTMSAPSATETTLAAGE